MRVQIELDNGLVRLIDEHAGPGGRSLFVREAVELELDRRRRNALLDLAGSMPDFASHLPPDWIRREREEATRVSERRLRDAGWIRE